MATKQNYQDFLDVLKKNGINKLYHFTDRDNLESIIKNGGLYSWMDCKERGITIRKPGGGELSRQLDLRDGLQNYVRVSFTRQHPMMFVAMKDGRISNPVILEIDPAVVGWEYTKYADRNATRDGAQVGSTLAALNNIHFSSLKVRKHFDLPEDEQKYFQAEVLVKNFIPLEAITNISNFGIPLPSKPNQLLGKEAYTAQISRSNPTAFIFLIDQSISMRNKTSLFGEEMTLAEAAARIVNRTINELVLRCIKSTEIRNYYDIAVIGYGRDSYYGWQGELEGKSFVTPEELRDHPYKKIITREEKRTRRGVVVKEVEKVQWVESRCDGKSTFVHKALDKARELLDDWMMKHQNQDCYPPTIINITDGIFNGATVESVTQKANEIKSMFTNDGNVLLFNIHIVPGNGDNVVAFPISKAELGENSYGKILFDMSSLLPLRYNDDISTYLNDNRKERHSAMAVNADMTTLIQLMDIGTPTNISKANV